MKLMDLLREILGSGKYSRFKIRGEISGTNHAEISATNIRQEPLTWDTSLSDVAFGMQALTSGNTYTPQPYRIDNAHGFIHEHWTGSVFPASVHLGNMSGAITIGFARLNNKEGKS